MISKFAYQLQSLDVSRYYSAWSLDIIPSTRVRELSTEHSQLLGVISRNFNLSTRSDRVKCFFRVTYSVYPKGQMANNDRPMQRACLFYDNDQYVDEL